MDSAPGKSMSSLEVTTDHSRIDLDFICNELASCYWAIGRPRAKIEASVANSLGFALLADERQVGFARVISDFATFAYLCDVVVAREFRGRGFAFYLLERVFADHRLATVNWTLRTKDAHGLYEKLGFERTFRPERYMERSALNGPASAREISP